MSKEKEKEPSLKVNVTELVKQHDELIKKVALLQDLNSDLQKKLSNSQNENERVVKLNSALEGELKAGSKSVPAAEVSGAHLERIGKLEAFIRKTLREPINCTEASDLLAAK